MIDKTPVAFVKYKSGYMDGYCGNSIQLPEDKMYMFGYEAGAEDDAMGNDNRFLENAD